MQILAAEEFHDITGPVDYFLVQPWMIFCAVATVLLLAGLTYWLGKRWRSRPVVVPTPRQRALDLLARGETENAKLTTYQFSIRVSYFLPRYVTEKYVLPVTRQTSVEFLNALAATSFTGDEQMLLTDFLNRCDLIKFARYEATRGDSRPLLAEAERFVKGGVLAPA